MITWRNHGKSDNGATLISILFAIVLLSLMLVALTVSIFASSKDVQITGNTFQALSNARSGIGEAYQELTTTFASMGTTFQGISTQAQLQTAAESLLAKYTANLSTANSTTVTFGSVSLNVSPGSDTILSSSTPVSIAFGVTVTGLDHASETKLQDTFTISGVIPSLNYVIFTPGNLIINGAPSVTGDLVSGGGTYVDNTPFFGTVGMFNSSDLHYLNSDFQLYPISFLPELPGLEPIATPSFSNSTLYTSAAYAYQFYYDQLHNDKSHYNRFIDGLSWTNHFGTAQDIVSPMPLQSQSDISTYLGTSVNVQPISSSIQAFLKDPSYTVSQYVSNGFSTVSHLPNVNIIHKVSSRKWAHRKSVTYEGTTEITNPTIYSGNLTIIDPNGMVTFDQPIYVAGNLLIEGPVNAKGAIFVKGDVFIENASQSANNNMANNTNYRMEVYADGPITVQTLQSSDWGNRNYAPNQPLVLNAYLASASTMYLGGMSTYLQIHGGIMAQNVILNSTLGASQYISGYDNYLHSANLQDKSPRLSLIYDASYVDQPVAGTPIVQNLVVQPLSQPTLVP